MGAFAAALKTQGANALGYAAGGVLSHGLGLIFAKQQDKRQLAQQQRLQNLEIQGTNALQDRAQERQLEMWEKTGYGAQMRQLKEAGLNPGLIYGQSGMGGQTTGSGGPQASGADAPKGGGEAVALMGMALQNQKTAAEMRLIEAQTAKTATETKNIGEGGVQFKGMELDNIIKEVAGEAARGKWDTVDKPNLEGDARARTDSNTMTMALGQTMSKLWEEGELYNKGMAEIKGIMLENAKTDEQRQEIQERIKQIKSTVTAQDLDNAMKEIDLKLQKASGLTKDSPGYIKAIGGILLKMFNMINE